MIAKKKYYVALVLGVLILAQLLYNTYVFAYKKEGLHSDENWSYCFANANYETLIYQDENGETQNFNAWMDGQLFRDYIEVQRGHEFDYKAVLYNMSIELNPPLHSLVLHTICSFFPETFSVWYAYVINVIAFIFTMITMFFLAKGLGMSDKISLLVCAVYGFSQGALSTHIFLRGYALLTLFSVLFGYFHVKMIKRQEKNVIRIFLFIYIVMLAGTMTHFNFLILGFFYAIVFGGYFLLKKWWKKFALYALTMFISVVTAMVIWPRTFEVFMGSNEVYNIQMPLLWEVEQSLRLCIANTTGILYEFPSIVFWTYVKWILILGSIVLLLFCFLFRNEKWFCNGIQKIKEKLPIWSEKLWSGLRKANKMYAMFFLVWLGTVIVIAHFCNMYSMGLCGLRYFFFVLPYVSIIYVNIICTVMKKLIRKTKCLRWVMGVVVLLFCVVISHVWMPQAFLFPRESNGVRIENVVKGENVILITDKEWRLTCYTSLAKDVKRFFAVQLDGVMEQIDEISKLPDSTNPVYVIIEEDFAKKEGVERNVSESDEMSDVLVGEEIFEGVHKVSEILGEIQAGLMRQKRTFIHREKTFMGTVSVWKIE